MWWAKLNAHTDASAGRDQEVIMGSLIDAVVKWLRCGGLNWRQQAGTLTRARSVASGAETEVETPRLWAVCLITQNQYLKMWWAKPKLKALNAHTDASDNLCACSLITRMRMEISAACYESRCQSCRPIPMYWNERRFLGLDNFLIKALHLLHLVDGCWYWSIVINIIRSVLGD